MWIFNTLPVRAKVLSHNTFALTGRSVFCNRYPRRCPTLYTHLSDKCCWALTKTCNINDVYKGLGVALGYELMPLRGVSTHLTEEPKVVRK